MLYLAKVSLTRETGEASLQLLARQKSEHHWVLSTNKPSIAVSSEDLFHSDGVLVLVQLNPEHQLESIEDATDWVLSIVKKYLLTGIAPDVLHAEAERAEEWRKDLTLKTQDLARRALELETRRDQIQELEKTLEAERQQLETVRLQVEHDKDQPQSNALSISEHSNADKRLDSEHQPGGPPSDSDKTGDTDTAKSMHNSEPHHSQEKNENSHPVDAVQP